jgi:hypothetical protein
MKEVSCRGGRRAFKYSFDGLLEEWCVHPMQHRMKSTGRRKVVVSVVCALHANPPGHLGCTLGAPPGVSGGGMTGARPPPTGGAAMPGSIPRAGRSHLWTPRAGRSTIDRSRWSRWTVESHRYSEGTRPDSAAEKAAAESPSVGPVPAWRRSIELRPLRRRPRAARMSNLRC